MNKQFYSWEYFHTLVKQLKRQITSHPNIIVSIGKGGSIPGVILAEEYSCTNLNLGLKSYKGQTRGNIHEYQSIICFDDLRDARILIVDDIADSGETLQFAWRKFIGNGCDKVQTASVFYKPCSKFKPNYIGLEVKSDVWIVQPWEILE
jgi:hypoxanthine phosphoribosyltransferase